MWSNNYFGHGFYLTNRFSLFKLEARIGSWASIVCDASYGPFFSAGISVSGAFDDKCWSDVTGFQYVNPTGRRANEVMTGRKHFKPVVVEVYSF